MRRIRLRDLHYHKQQNPRAPSKQVAHEPEVRPVWQNDYYHFKSQLASLHRRNQQVQLMVAQYQTNPSVFNLKQIENQLKINCRKIDEIDAWTNHFPYTQSSPLQRTLENNLVRHFKQSILDMIAATFRAKEQISAISQEQSMRQQSFYTLNHSRLSQNALNISHNESMERSFAIQEVTARVQNLNAIMRRMGDVVANQGDLIDRIDENLASGHQHVSMGRQLLGARAAREQGEEEDNSFFNFSSKINSAINGLYIINLILILILVIKNL